jgi:phosphoribosylformimino-5-aminoimidazole carboxamide ribotide isomerase
MKFRPCIDLHDGLVKQIVGSTLSDRSEKSVTTNFQSEKPPEWFAGLYRKDHFNGGHVIMLGPGNETAAERALAAWPGGLQVGGGITVENAGRWIDAGAEAVIVTSWVFHDGLIDMERLDRLTQSIGKEHLVIDLSCRMKEGRYLVVTNRWQSFTSEAVTHELLERLSGFCKEFLIHAVDVEGKMSGIETPLVSLLGAWEGVPLTYAGGIRSFTDIDAIEALGKGRIDFTVGSALDIFGGSLIRYDDLVKRFAIKREP